ncbi:MAG: SRPBCC family protein [Sandaracinaceae bacterium]|nr:SRPBCC family protein [Sandaracinaceae bacterium]
MRRVSHAVPIDAPPGEVAALVGAFDLFADFHPQVAGCEADGVEVGARRALLLADGQTITEQLVEDLAPGYVYASLGPSENMASWRGRIEIAPRGEHALVTWTLEVEPREGVDADALMQRAQGLLEEGLGAAKRFLERLD